MLSPGMAVAIITESALSFLGLGFPSDFPTWGRLLYDGKDFIQITPMRVVGPGTLVTLTVISINYIGDGLRDALDPKVCRRSVGVCVSGLAPCPVRGTSTPTGSGPGLRRWST